MKCACGCRQKVKEGNKFIKFHNNRGKFNPMYGKIPWNKKLTKENDERVKKMAENESRNKKISKAKLNNKNPMWRGDEVGYSCLHDWVKRRKPKPELCECCKEKPPFDLANISGEYKRDINDYEWLCRTCHMGFV